MPSPFLLCKQKTIPPSAAQMPNQTSPSHPIPVVLAGLIWRHEAGTRPGQLTGTSITLETPARQPARRHHQPLPVQHRVWCVAVVRRTKQKEIITLPPIAHQTKHGGEPPNMIADVVHSTPSTTSDPRSCQLCSRASLTSLTAGQPYFAVYSSSILKMWFTGSEMAI